MVPVEIGVDHRHETQTARLSDLVARTGRRVARQVLSSTDPGASDRHVPGISILDQIVNNRL